MKPGLKFGSLTKEPMVLTTAFRIIVILSHSNRIWPVFNALIWAAAKIMLRGKFIAKNTDTWKKKKSQTNSLILHRKNLENSKINSKLTEGRRWKQEQKSMNLKTKPIETINEIKSVLFENINKLYKPLGRLKKKKREGTN